MIWDLADESENWPTFGELDRRWDSQHDSDVMEVLRELPKGLINGIDLHVYPQETTRIALTVAGAVACKASGTTLTVFLDFVRIATESERGWQPPAGDPEAQPSLTDQDYADRSAVLPEAGREHLLRMLYLLIHSEPSVWTGLGGPDADGHWRVTLGRRIRRYRKILDLSDYLILRDKPWEAKSSGTPGEPVSEGDRLVGILTASQEVLADVLLSDVYFYTEGNVDGPAVYCGQLCRNMPESSIKDAIGILVQRKLINAWPVPPHDLPIVRLTEIGVQHVETNRDRWNDRVYRDRAVRNALLDWLHDQRDAPQGSVPLTSFLQDPRSALGPIFFTANDLDAAAAYLSERGLIEGTAHLSQLRGPAWARITANGIDCIEQGGNVADYLTPPAGSVRITSTPR